MSRSFKIDWKAVDVRRFKFPWCLVVNAADIGAIGIRCHFANLDGFDVLDDLKKKKNCVTFSTTRQGV